MNWARGKDGDGNPDNYYLTSGRLNICLIRIGEKRILELWDTSRKDECLASVKAWNEMEKERALRHLKALAEEMSSADNRY